MSDSAIEQKDLSKNDNDRIESLRIPKSEINAFAAKLNVKALDPNYKPLPRRTQSVPTAPSDFDEEPVLTEKESSTSRGFVHVCYVDM